jgi:hypothetical protein
MLVRPHFHEQAEHFVQRRMGLGVGAVDLVDDDNWPQARFQRL